jgi:hypothetical protein
VAVYLSVFCKSLETDDEYFAGLVNTHVSLCWGILLAVGALPGIVTLQNIRLTEVFHAILQIHIGLIGDRQVQNMELFKELLFMVAIKAFKCRNRAPIEQIINDRP